MALKKLLVALTTTRAVEGKDRRVRFAAGKVVDLNEEELTLLDTLTKKTGKLHYRDPIQEGGGKMVASDPEVVVVPDFAGQDVAIRSKSVDQLKAYLDFHGVEYANNANKAALTDLATKHEAGQTDDKSGGSGGSGEGSGEGSGDPDGGL